MSKKIPWAYTIALMLLTAALTVVITVSVSMKRYNALIGDLPSKKTQVSVLSELDELLRTQYLGEIEAARVTTSGLKGYMYGLGDENARYLTADEYERFLQTESGVYHGAGIEVRFESSLSALVVTSIDRASFAYRQGIRVGDGILAVDTQAVTATNADALTKKLLETLPQSVQVRVKGADETEAVVVTIEKTYRADAIEEAIEGTVGYLRIRGFFENTPSLVKEGLDRLLSQGAAAIIVDLRGCESYGYDSCAKTLDLFVPAAADPATPMFSAVNKAGETVRTYTSDGQGVTLPVAVLIDRNTKGAAELFACDLRDFGVAVLVGEKTAGVGVLREVFRLDSADAVLLPVASVKPYKSESFHGVGVSPDETVSLSESARKRLDSLSRTLDAQFLKAVEALGVAPAAAPPAEPSSEPASEEAASGEETTAEQETQAEATAEAPQDTTE